MDQVDEVKQKADIVNIIGERVKLVRAGRNFKALCPFHSERTPSFMVSPELQIFKCFGCQKAGDVYTFLNEFEGMEFPDALQYLAQKTGVRLKPFKKDRDYEKKERLREINHLASEYYHFLLTDHKVGKNALGYLAERGIAKKAMDFFKLGYAAGSWDALIRYLVKKKQYKMDELRQAGLVVESRGRTYDRFRNRIIFPLRDVRGNIIGFAGRQLPGSEDEGGKYINSPETELYHKSENLYGLYENRVAIKKKDFVLVVEGELDAISSWQVGIRNIVAVKGTALTKEQIELMRRYTRNISLALDADSAGDAATKRGIAIADEASLNIKVVLLIGGKDPDEIAKSDPKKWKQMVERASSVYDFFLASIRKRFDIDSGIGKKLASEEMVPVLTKISNSIVRAHYIKKFASMLNVSEESVIDEIRRYERLAISKAEPIKEGKETLESKEKSRREILEEYLLVLLLQGGEKVRERYRTFTVDILSKTVIKRITQELIQKKEDLVIGVFIKNLPAELREVAEQAFLKELNLKSDNELILKEIEKVLKELVWINTRSRMDGLSKEIAVLTKRAKLNSQEKKRLEDSRREFVEISKDLS